MYEKIMHENAGYNTAMTLKLHFKIRQIASATHCCALYPVGGADMVIKHISTKLITVMTLKFYFKYTKEP